MRVDLTKQYSMEISEGRYNNFSYCQLFHFANNIDSSFDNIPLAKFLKIEELTFLFFSVVVLCGLVAFNNFFVA